MQALAGQWLVAPTEAEQRRPADEIQRESFDALPSLPLGRFFIRTACRSNVTAVLKGTSPHPWNVRNA